MKYKKFKAKESQRATYSAKFTGGNDDASLVQHAGIEVQHVIHIHCHKVFC